MKLHYYLTVLKTNDGKLESKTMFAKSKQEIKKMIGSQGAEIKAVEELEMNIPIEDVTKVLHENNYRYSSQLIKDLFQYLEQ